MRFENPLSILLASGLLLLGCKGSPKPAAESPASSKATPMGSAAAAPGTDPKGSGAMAAARPRRPSPPAKGVLAEPDIWTTVDAVKNGCASHLREAERLRKLLLAVKGKRTLENTLKVYNRIHIQIDRILPKSELVANTNPTKAVRSSAEKCEQQAKRFLSRLKLDGEVYRAIKAVDSKGLDPHARRFVRLTLRDYRRAGVDRDSKTRKRLAELDALRVKLGQAFQRNIREDKRFILVTEKELEGMPADFVRARARASKRVGSKIKITTAYPDFFPLESYATSERVRRALYFKYLRRGYPKNESILKRLLVARHAYATLLGYKSWADYNAEDKMVKSAKVIADFIDRVATLARPKMRTDLADILARKRKDVPGAKVVGAWDRFYYVKKIQAERFGVKPAEVRAYFDFRSVKKGLLDIAQQLWQVKFRRVPGAKVWHPSVEAYDVTDHGTLIGRFYLDLHPREGKYGHAAEFPILTGINGVQLPSAALVTNFPDPSKTGGGPALTEHHQVTTFFHEFGHLMHKILAGHHDWVNQSGIACEWDFVEAPSQLMEEWAWDAKILARFARHHRTKKPISAALVAKMRKANEFGKGVQVMRQMHYAALSFNYHNRDPRKLDLLGLLKWVQKKYSPFPYERSTYSYCNFGHLQGYSSMYYTYMWSLVLAKDLFTRFEKEGLMNPKTAMDFRRKVLEPGGSRDAVDMVKDFLGRPYSFAAYRAWLSK